MIKLFLKKVFFDSWDNILSLLLINLINLIPILLFILILSSFSTNLFILLFIGLLALKALIDGINSVYVKSIVYYQKSSVATVLEGLKKSYRHIILYFFIELIIGSIAVVALPFYFSIGTLLTVSITLILVFTLILILFTQFYFFPLATAMSDDGPFKTLKKSFLLVLDNFTFTLFFCLHHLINLILSLFFATLIPGLSAIALSRQVAVKFLLLKYDYLEKNTTKDKKELDWNTLLSDDIEKIGKRDLKGTLFPWKE